MPGALDSSEPLTLACRLTPPGEGGISLIELSGPRAPEILDTLFSNPRKHRASTMRPGRLLYGRLLKEGETLDEVILDCVRLSPQPAFVVNCHGGAVAAARVMQALSAAGARPCSSEERAEAMRAQGMMDAIQAEAAEAIPRAPTLRAVAHLLDQSGGALAVAIETLRGAAARADWATTSCGVERLLETAAFGRALTSPPRLVLAGRPNVGKSTLANALLRYDRMIVHHEPGTTRDTVEELLSIGELPFLLADTAGLRDSENAIEREGVERTRRALRRAEVALLLFDASAPLQEEDIQLLSGELPERVVPVLNKCDLPGAISVNPIREKTGRDPVAVSAARGEGIGELEERIVKVMWPAPPARGQAILFTERQEKLMRAAKEAAAGRSVERFLEALDMLCGGHGNGDLRLLSSD